jgi:molybdopterin-guanine dinucleotide biosynthesis protein MobB
VGERDLVRPALRRAGVAIEFEAVAMKPGARVAFGRAGHRLIFGLPGTPSACRVAFHILVVPALRALLGYREPIRPEVVGRLAAPVRVRPGRRRYLWALATLGAGGITVTPHMVQSTATLRASGDANALIVLDADTGELPAGSRVRIQLLEPAAIPIVPSSRMAAASRPEVIGVVGARGAGKTTLIERLIPVLARYGLSVAVVKHHGHQRALDENGSDTARAASAGAVTTVLVGPGGTTARTSALGDPSLEDAVAHAGAADLVLVEGFSRSPIPKILVLGGSSDPAKAAPAGPIVATVGNGDGEAADAAAAAETPPRFHWDQIEQLARFIVSRGGGSLA